MKTLIENLKDKSRADKTGVNRGNLGQGKFGTPMG